jgi:predicted nucleotidyltransferase
MEIIDKNMDKITALCDKHKVAKLFVFGSILTDHYKKSSDIDLLVDFTGVDTFD